MFIKRHRKAAGNQRGNVIVETALVVIILFSFVFATVDLSLILYAKLVMQHAVRSGARYAVTGPTDPDPDDPLSRLELVEQKIKDSSIGLCDKSTCNINFYQLDGTVITGSDTGIAGEIIIVEVADYTWPLITPLLKPFLGDDYTFTVRATMRNEPFPSS